MKYEVILKYFQDEQVGNWGLAPEKTIGHDTSFNAFWGPDGIFHDVFEHYMEGIDPYYSQRGFMTIWGEMAASGHSIAYHDIGINNFRYRRNPNRDFKVDTMSIIEELLYNLKNDPDDFYLKFDSFKESCLVPRQRIPYNYSTYNLESEIFDYEYTIAEKAELKEIKLKTVLWKPGIRRNYIYGYKQALKIIGSDKKHSYTVLDEFLEYWNKITKNSAEYLALEESEHGLDAIKFVVSNTGKLKVKTTLIEKCTREEYPLERLTFY
jgi:hypothetical protein